MALGKIIEGMLNDFCKDYIIDDLALDKAFEYFVNYLVVSKFHPDAFSGDKGDLERLVVDEKSQFGLDAIAFIVNGNLVLSKEDIDIYTKSKQLDVDIVFIQTKTEEKCETGDLLKTIQATKTFLEDFDSISEVNSNILNAKEIYDAIFNYENYRYCTSKSPKCFIYYATVASDWDKKLINTICQSSISEMKTVLKDIKNFEIQVIGRNYIMDAYNEIQNSVSAKVNLKNCIILDKIQEVKEAYIGYLTGDDYLNIICDSNGDIRRRIFYENVRDYQGEDNGVNSEIRKTISEKSLQDKFVLLNNGVTIIAKSVVSLGANEYELADFQIVNGCQTSNEIFNCKVSASSIFVPVKIIYTTDADLISNIVKSTNRQSPVPEEAFIALTKYHKELQLLFAEYSKDMPIEMFYERRSGEEVDIKNRNGDYQIVTLHGLIRAFVSVYSEAPHIVYGTNPANILKSNTGKLFSADHKPELYYIASYLFVKFVSMQKERKFSKHDYALRYYIIMVVRMLMVKELGVLEFSSRDMKNEIKNIINILKVAESDSYFVEAKSILDEVLMRDEYKGRNRHDVLRTVEFNRIVKETVKNKLN
ncbi:MAG: AIPR family protein [Lachnospiraceae bacterium]|nr:AIPR family protein [Lachnospiraceae bacterium]